jgi:hypothetical protein
MLLYIGTKVLYIHLVDLANRRGVRPKDFYELTQRGLIGPG